MGYFFDDMEEQEWNLYAKVPGLKKEIYYAGPGVAYDSLEGPEVTDDNNCYLQVGVVGEVSKISAEKIARTYLLDGQELTPEQVEAELDGTYEGFRIVFTAPDDISEYYWARRVPYPTQEGVNTSWGAVMYTNTDNGFNGEGDFIVCRDDNGALDESDSWVVAGDVFEQSYQVA